MRLGRGPEGTKNQTQEVVARPIRICRRTRTAPMKAVLGASAHVAYLAPGVATDVRAPSPVSSGWAS